MKTRIEHGARVLLALGLAFSLVFAPGLASPAAAQGDGAIRGVLYQADGATRLPGAKVIAIHVQTRKQFVSGETAVNGTYEITGLPAGTYDIVVEYGGETFIADKLVDLERNQSLAVSYAVQPARPANRKIAGINLPKGSATPIGTFRGTGAAAAGKTVGKSFWTSAGGITLIAALAVGAAIVIDNNRGDGQASPSTP